MPFKKYSPKQKKLARISEPRNKITKSDLDVVRKKKMPKVKPEKAKEKAIKYLKKKRKK
jgi:hypothetical protein